MQRPCRIDRRQRLIAMLILAFCIDTLRPAVHPTAHRHAGGELPHVHVGDVASDSAQGHSLLFGAGLTHQTAPAHGKPALTRAPESDLHFHLVRSLQVAHVAPLTPVATVGRHLPTHVRDHGIAYAAATQPGTARAPPLLPA